MLTLSVHSRLRRFLSPPVLGMCSFTALLALTLTLQVRQHRSGRFEREPMEMDHSDALARWEFERLRDPATGEIPRGIRQRELEFARRHLSSTARFSLWSGGDQTQIGTTGWQQAGPVNAGGRTQMIGLDIANERNVLLASAQGGIWRSTDSGQSWTRSTRPEQIKDIMSLVQDQRPGKRNTWYCGSGELLSTTNRRVEVVGLPRYRTRDIGDGIFRSTDSGKSWSLLSSTYDPTVTTLDSAFDGVWNIVVNNARNDQDILYAAGYGAIMRSTDGGTTWSRTLGDPAHKSFCTDIAITSSGILYAYLSQDSNNHGPSSTAGVWRSTDGVNWTRITPSFFPAEYVRMRIALAPSNENVLYLAGETPGVGATEHGLYRYTYKSGDGSGTGGSWIDLSASLPFSTAGALYTFNSLGGYALTLKVLPTDENTVFLGGTNLYRTTDGFASVPEWIGGYNPDPNGGQSYPNHHPDNHDLVFSYSHPTKAYNANDGGIFVTQDILGSESDLAPVSWENLNNGFIASLIYVVAMDHATPHDSLLLGGFQDQGSWLGYPSQPWEQYDGGDGCYCAIANGKLAYYMSAQLGYVDRWYLDGALTPTTVTGVRPSNLATDPQFATPWLLDPNSPEQMFLVENNRLWRNSNLYEIPDGGWQTDVNWSLMGKATVSSGTVISALAMSVSPAHRLYYGTSDGHLYRIDNANATDTRREITSPLFPKQGFISCVAVDPLNADSIVVAFSNYHVRSLFASSDGGSTWNDVSGNLEENPDGSGDGPSVRWVTIVHQNGLRLFLVGTSVGLYSTTDLSGSAVQWQQEGPETIGHTIVENIDARQSDGFVAIATQGEGILTSHVTVTKLQNAVASESPKASLSLYPNPAMSEVRVQFTAGTTAYPGSVLLFNASGQSSRLSALKQDLNGFTIDVRSLASGTYYLQIETSEGVLTKRLVVRH